MMEGRRTPVDAYTMIQLNKLTPSGDFQDKRIVSFILAIVTISGFPSSVPIMHIAELLN